MKIECPICGLVSAAALFEKKKRKFYRCGKCRLRLQWPLPSLAELAKYYDQEFAQGMYLTFTEAEEMKLRTAEYRLRQVLRWTGPTGRWLDVGCANGVFVATAAKAGADACGIELSAVAVEQARRQGLQVCQATVEELPTEQRFDCITAFDVIEHVLEPRGFLEAIDKRLNPGGICVLTLPDVSSIFARLMGKNWWFYIPEEHLHYFAPGTITQLARRVGLETLRTSKTSKPLTFDYGLTQFKEFNPMIYRMLSTLSLALPKSLRAAIIPFYIGEMLVVLRKPVAIDSDVATVARRWTTRRRRRQTVVPS